MPEEGTQDPGTEEATETPTAEAKTENVYDQAAVNDITSKVRKTEEAKRLKLERELETLRAKSMSAEEKALDEARQQGAAEVQAKFDALQRETQLRSALLEGGLNPKKLSLALAVANALGEPDADADAILATVKESEPGWFGSQSKFGPSDGGSAATSKGAGWPPEKVEEILSKMDPAEKTRFWTQNGKEIAEWQDRNMGGIRVIPSGKNLHD